MLGDVLILPLFYNIIRKGQKIILNYLFFCYTGCTLFIWCCWKTLKSRLISEFTFLCTNQKKKTLNVPKGKT